MGLRDFIILNPQWVVDAVYSVLVDTEIGKNKGRFAQKKLDEIWKNYNLTIYLELQNGHFYHFYMHMKMN